MTERTDQEYGLEQGFNQWVKVNDERLFTEEARKNPAIQQFVKAPYGVYYLQLKSSSPEAEAFIHQPVEAMRGNVDGINGNIAELPADPRVATLVVNHELGLNRYIVRCLAIEDGAVAGQLIHKQLEPESDATPG